MAFYLKIIEEAYLVTHDSSGQHTDLMPEGTILFGNWGTTLPYVHPVSHEVVMAETSPDRVNWTPKSGGWQWTENFAMEAGPGPPPPPNPEE